jgi:hypothetical protein
VYHHILTDSLVIEQKVSRRSQKTNAKKKTGKKSFDSILLVPIGRCGLFIG